MASSLANNIYIISTIIPILLMVNLLLLSPLADSAPRRPFPESKNLPSLAERLKLEKKETDSPDCWESMFQLQACTGEVITFFLNGETYLGPSCCHAIRVIQHECWPNLLGTLGFTTQEGDILEGYCDTEAAVNASPPPPISITEPNY